MFFGDYKVAALYVTSNSSPDNKEMLREEDLPSTSFINEEGHIIDKVDYPFEDDPEVIGCWESVGFVKNIGTVYRTTDIFALSSEEEGLCTSILDAMYFGLPIVATSAGGIPELVQDSINGFIVPVHDYMLFAERLYLLIEAPDRRNKMGLRSSDILKQNTIENTIIKTFDVYSELCC